MSVLSLSLFDSLPASLRLADLLDIGVIAVFLYFALSWVRFRASRAGLAAVASAAMLYAIARLTNMYLTLLLFQAGFTILLLALVLVFQDDLRRLFSRVATLGFRSKTPSAADDAADTLTEVVCRLADERIGALVVMKGRESVDPHVDGGTAVDGQLSAVLLYSIFHRASPGHDGAVLVDGDRIERLGVRLPLSQNQAEIGGAGTRHTAALGLAERTDSLVLVVSEERGQISAAQRGRLVRIESAAELKSRLDEYYRQRRPASAGHAWHHLFSRRLGAKLASLALAIVLWLVFVYQLHTVQRTYLIPIEYRNLPESLVVEDPTPAQIRVTLSGPEGIFALFHPDTAAISLDLGSIREGRQEIVVTDDDLKRPPALVVDALEPRTVWLSANKLVQVELPVKIQFEGHLPGNLALVDATAEPAKVPLLVPRSQQQVIQQVRTEPIDLDELSETTSRNVDLVLPYSTRFVSARPPKVRVTVKVAGSPSHPETGHAG